MQPPLADPLESEGEQSRPRAEPRVSAVWPTRVPKGDIRVSAPGCLASRHPPGPKPARQPPPAGGGVSVEGHRTLGRLQMHHNYRNTCATHLCVGCSCAFAGCSAASEFLISTPSTSSRCAQRGAPQDWGSGVWAERSVSRLHLFSPAHPPYTYLCLPRAQRRSVLCDDLLALGILGGEKRVEGGGVERMELMGAQPGWVVSGAFSGGRGEPGLLHVQRVVKRTDGQGEAGCGHLGPMDIMHAILKNFAIVSNVRCSECSRTRSRFLASFEQSTVCSTGSEFPGQSTGVGCLGKVPTSLGLSPLLCPSWALGGDQVGGRRPSTLLSPQAHTLNSSLVFLLCLLWFNLATLSVFLRTVPRLSRYLCIS